MPDVIARAQFSPPTAGTSNTARSLAGILFTLRDRLNRRELGHRTNAKLPRHSPPHPCLTTSTAGGLIGWSFQATSQAIASPDVNANPRSPARGMPRRGAPRSSSPLARWSCEDAVGEARTAGYRTTAVLSDRPLDARASRSCSARRVDEVLWHRRAAMHWIYLTAPAFRSRARGPEVQAPSADVASFRRHPASREEREQVLLAGLAKGEPVKREGLAKAFPAMVVAAQRHREDVTLDRSTSRVDPVRVQVAVGMIPLARGGCRIKPPSSSVLG
jgi:hypothetical protein